MDIIYATQFGPDVALSFFTSMSIFSFLKGTKEKKNKLLVLSGIFAGISYLIKSIGALIIIVEFFYVLYIIISEKKLKLQYLYVPLGFLLIFGIEALTYYSFLHDPLYHYRIDKESFLLPAFLEHGRNSDLRFLPYSMFNIWTSDHLGSFGYFYWFLIPAMIFGIVKKEKNIIILMVWFLFLFLYMEFGSMSLTSYILMDRLPRYILLITIPGMLIVAYFLSYFLEHSKRRFFQFAKITSLLAIMGILIVTSIYYVRSSVNFFNEFMDEVRYAYRYLKTLPEKNVYACSWVIFKLDYYFGFKETERMKTINLIDSIKNIKDSYVVMNGTRECVSYYEEFDGNRTCAFTEGWGPKDICDTPANWKLLKTIEVPGSRSIYKPTIYYSG
jgi:4-amino-4-deoxy-L-arabinose transferase-like glycosyltransferase